jgi:hypothetical protein
MRIAHALPIVLLAPSAAFAADPSCRDTAGVPQSATYVAQCLAVSPATAVQRRQSLRPDHRRDPAGLHDASRVVEATASARGPGHSRAGLLQSLVPE